MKRTQPLRRHQRLALEALDRAWADGRRRAWVELPPGAGKTRIGIETAQRLLAAGEVTRAVALGPNHAIVGQWAAEARRAGLDTAEDRHLGCEFTALTYQSVAVFDDRDEDEEPAKSQESLTDRLHENGRELLARLQQRGRVLLILDESHHLLQVWGKLLRELLDGLPDAWVLGLTATPPGVMTKDEAKLADKVFGRPVFEVSIPAVVREGDLAPFAELVWATTPTLSEEDWLRAEAERWRELTTQLTDPATGFLPWLDGRFIDTQMPWRRIVDQWPEESAAALRLHHAGLLALPAGARVLEEHRRPPTPEDWVVLVEDWLAPLMRDEEKQATVDAVRRALPSVGYVLTKKGIRRGRSGVDRVLARSESKARAAVELLGVEHRNLGDRLRMLVLCDHERASATLPADLEGVLAAQAGSAWAVLEAALRDPVVSTLHPLLVTGATVAGDPATIKELTADRPDLAVVDDGGIARVEGRWTSREWVPVVTEFFEAGRSRALIGTRGLLGEGWDARSITGLIDLTAATTSTAVVQTRGRALRADLGWPDKVALNWSVVCVTDEHPGGDSDWLRLVRKHDGFYCVDGHGEIVDGVAHLDPALSPFAPPSPETLDGLNARMIVRSEARDAIHDSWNVGEEYVDDISSQVRISATRTLEPLTGRPVPVVLMPTGIVDRAGSRPAAGVLAWACWTAALATAIAAFTTPGVVLPILSVLLVLAGVVIREARTTSYGRRLLAEAATPPGVDQVAGAVAEALLACHLVDSSDVSVALGDDGSYHCVLTGVPAGQSALFADALDEAVSPLREPRYVVPRWVRLPGPVSRSEARRAAKGKAEPNAQVWHPVPTVLGQNAANAQEYAKAFDRWLGGGRALRTATPEGQGVLAAQQGDDPFDVTTVMRRTWS